MKVFIDTNVLAGALATRGLCADIFHELLHFHALIISRDVIDELKEVLSGKFHVPDELIKENISFLNQVCTIVDRGDDSEVVFQDASDVPIIGAALSAGVDVFITGDKGIQSLKTLKGVDFLSPREFWEKHRRGGEDPGL